MASFRKNGIICGSQRKAFPTQTGRMANHSTLWGAPTWMQMGHGGPPTVTPSCKGPSARWVQVLYSHGTSTEMEENGNIMIFPPTLVIEWWGQKFPLIQCFFSGSPSSHKWSYNGSCPKSIEDSSWLPFRNHCYAFHMEVMLGQKEAMKRCQKGKDFSVFNVYLRSRIMLPASAYNLLLGLDCFFSLCWLSFPFQSKHHHLV